VKTFTYNTTRLRYKNHICHSECSVCEIEESLLRCFDFAQHDNMLPDGNSICSLRNSICASHSICHFVTRYDINSIGIYIAENSLSAIFYTPLYAENPPSTGTTTPFTKPDAFGSKSQRRVPKSSCGSPKRSIGVWEMILLALSL